LLHLLVSKKSILVPERESDFGEFKKKWGDLEEDGVCFLQPYGDRMYEVKIPFLLACQLYCDGQMNFPKEPLFSDSPTLTNEENEIQDLCTILTGLSQCKKGSIVDLNSIIELIPQLWYSVVVPSNLDYIKFNLKNSQINSLNEFYSFVQQNSKSFKNKSRAFLNGVHSHFADSFIILDVTNLEGIDYLVLFLQSKRKATIKKQREIDTQLVADTDKTIRGFSTKLKMAFVYLYITDALTVLNSEQYDERRDHVFVINQEKQKQFYGEYRWQLKRLRDKQARIDPNSTVNINWELSLKTNCSKFTKEGLQNILSSENIAFSQQMTKVDLITRYKNYKKNSPFPLDACTIYFTIEPQQSHLQSLEELGAKVDERLSLLVTHIVARPNDLGEEFFQEHSSRKICVVNEQWVYDCCNNKKLMNPKDYQLEQVEKMFDMWRKNAATRKAHHKL